MLTNIKNLETVEKIETIKNSCSDIRLAIEEKGGEISGDLTTYAEAISNIKGGDSNLNFEITPMYDYHVCAPGYVTKLKIKEGVTEIGAPPDSIGLGYSGLDGFRCNTLEIPDTVTTINPYGFALCKFEKIYLPDSITEINSYAFENTLNLIYIKMPAFLSYYSSEEPFYGSSVLYIDFYDSEVIPDTDWFIGGELIPSDAVLIVNPFMLDIWKQSPMWSAHADLMVTERPSDI